MSLKPRPFPAGRRERGAVTIIVALSLVVLLFMLGLVLDLGHLYIAKTELQNAADACALSAARELNDRGTGATERATAAGLTVGNRHRVDLQADDVAMVAADVQFSASLSGPWENQVTQTTVYARCTPHQSNPRRLTMWFMRLAGLEETTLWAEAIARPVGGQSFCAIPLAMCTTAAAGTPNLGFVEGTWYSGRLSAGSARMGNFDWIRFEGQGAADLGELLAGPGMCNIAPRRVDVERGVSQGAAPAWNTRFGLYSGTWNDIDRYAPDRTGWAYTPDRLNKKGEVIPGSWPAAEPQNAYPDYVQRKNVTHDPYNPTAMLDDTGKVAVLPGNPAPLSRELHASKGQDRRLVVQPVIRCADWVPNARNLEVLDWACALMISPIDDPDSDVQLEFRGLVSQGACGTTGLPGNLGPPVPALVR